MYYLSILSLLNIIQQSVKRKKPCCVDDVREIIKAFPQFLLTKHAEASLFLFGLHTGARSVSCKHVELKNIKKLYVELTPDNTIRVGAQV